MATIKDVAKMAGVTVTTVSRVLNNRGYISEKTRNKVAEAMKELQYQPNEIARSLYRQKSNIIGLIIPTVAHSFFGELASHIEYYAYECGYKILLCNSHLNRKKEKEYVEMLKRHKVDGILMGSHTLEIDEYLNLNLPIVTFDRQITNSIPFVSSDNFEGGRLAANLLIQKGCRKIAHISGNLSLNMLSNKRYEAFIIEVVANRVEHITVQTEVDVFDIPQNERLIYNMFKEYPDIDGVFTSDITAVQVIQACSRLNKRIPEDIKIIGYDDIQLASLIVPQLTTIRQPMAEMSKRAVELLIKQINGKEVLMENIFPVRLVERNTT
ncbi:LacI family transcriptional regulator [Hydrogenispora ethanolica]|uniref:LacI family transcriptional regulator n=1 Tax=Hydrogenispora ethanolica TaxID=1082276 RepID=A0A4R1RAQ3_HYDET|nr:LacI family DNA-binding transcriptional regulator [Hydrogenispora ethanolica]TCL62729.1 LacI family transcriptional regulator [Hydrogenispora ethanolica]